MKRISFAWFFVGMIVVVPLSAYAVVKWYQQHYQALPVLSPEGHQLKSFVLLNQEGKHVTDAGMKGNKIGLSNFFFTHCPVICPKMMRNLSNVHRLFINDDAVQMNSFSVDPEHDSVGRLKEYAENFAISGQWNLLTGDKRVIYSLARKSFLVDATDGDGGPQDFIHSDKVILTDEQGRIRGYYNGTDAVEMKKLVEDITRLKKESKNN